MTAMVKVGLERRERAGQYREAWLAGEAEGNGLRRQWLSLQIPGAEGGLQSNMDKPLLSYSRFGKMEMVVS